MKLTFSSAVRSALIAGAALPTLAVGPLPRMRAPVRRPVAIVLSIDAPTYWDRLDQSTTCAAHCQQLQAALVEPIRLAFAKKFAFADWTRPTTPPADTVLVRWAERPPPDTPGAWVEFRLIGSTGRAHPDSIRIAFEDFSNVIERSDWTVATVRDQWMRRVSSALNASDLVPFVFGKIAVNVQVPFTRGLARVRVPLSGTDIGASEEAPPAFRVVATIDDPGPPRTSASAEVILTGCIGTGSYVCDISEVRYPGPKVVSGNALATLLARNPGMTTKSVHLQTYVAGRPPLNAPGGDR